MASVPIQIATPRVWDLPAGYGCERGYVVKRITVWLAIRPIRIRQATRQGGLNVQCSAFDFGIFLTLKSLDYEKQHEGATVTRFRRGVDLLTGETRNHDTRTLSRTI